MVEGGGGSDVQRGWQMSTDGRFEVGRQNYLIHGVLIAGQASVFQPLPKPRERVDAELQGQ